MNISVPDDLKRRMDRVKEQANWSALACRAFEIKLGEIAATKESRTMENVIQRLRGSKVEADSETEKRGTKAGREWAKGVASVAELKRLARQLGSGEWTFASEFSDAFSAGEHLFFIISPDDQDRAAATDFWERAVGDDHEELSRDPVFIDAFAIAAIDLWHEVADSV